MGELAILGGPAAITAATIGPAWPIHDLAEVRALREVLNGAVWGGTGMGPKIEQFNSAWAQYCGTTRSVALANGTTTMELALRAQGVGPGDEVVVPAWTFMATATVVSQVGATPVFVDIEDATLCLDPSAFEAAITPRTRAVIPVHFGGHPADMLAITSIAAAHGILVIEDAAQAHGAILAGRKMGSFGFCGSYSFQQSKNLQCGEGGSIVTDDESFADRLHYSLSKFGRGKRGDEYSPFTHHELAGNACMTEFQAAILLAQLNRLDDQAEQRVISAAHLERDLSNLDGITPLRSRPGVDRHGYHLFLMRVAADVLGGLTARRFVAALRAEGVPCATLYPRPLFEEPVYTPAQPLPMLRTLPKVVTHCPSTYRACQEIIAIPQTALLGTDGEIDAMIEAISKVHRGRHRLQ